MYSSKNLGGCECTNYSLFILLLTIYRVVGEVIQLIVFLVKRIPRFIGGARFSKPKKNHTELLKTNITPQEMMVGRLLSLLRWSVFMEHVDFPGCT